ncbi:MAG: homoserine kinase [Pseudomonadota bacterium]
MAVYTQVSAEALAAFLTRYDVGTPVSAKGIAEGVENSNYLVETSGGGAEGGATRFILTLYEKRVDEADLPYFIGLTTHLADAGLPVPRPIRDREGRALQRLEGRAACLIGFLPGVSVGEVAAPVAHEAGRSLGRLHAAVADFSEIRANEWSLTGWQRLAASLGDRLDEIEPGLTARVAHELTTLDAVWPADLPRGTIHADLFPDNVLILDGRVTGLIDFYFACTDSLAYDLAVTHAAWAFDDMGDWRGDAVGAALIAGYEAERPLIDAERAALPILCRGATLRFLLTRAHDWLTTPADALVTRKYPLAFLKRLDHYRAR